MPRGNYILFGGKLRKIIFCYKKNSISFEYINTSMYINGDWEREREGEREVNMKNYSSIHEALIYIHIILMQTLGA